jgi:hypothetical protein
VEYDRNGYMAAWNYFSNGWHARAVTTNNGRLREETYLVGDREDHYRRKYGRYGLTSVSQLRNGRWMLLSEIDYDKKGRPTRSVSFSEDGSPSSKVVTHYDDRARCSDELSYESGVADERTHDCFDRDGTLISRTRLGSDGEVALRLRARRMEVLEAWVPNPDEYDGESLWVKRTGDHVETLMLATGGVARTQRTDFLNAKSHVPTHSVCAIGSSYLEEARFDYRFDEHGNWVERTTYVRSLDRKFIATTLTTRRIDYYADVTAKGKRKLD